MSQGAGEQMILVEEPRGRGSFWPCLAFGIGLLVIYLANGREIGQYDTEAAVLQQHCLLRGKGIYLDGFRYLLTDSKGVPIVYVSQKRGHLVSRYPLAPVLVACPLSCAQGLVLDRLQPGWDRRIDRLLKTSHLIAKNSAAVIVALTGALLLGWLRALGLGRVSWPAAIAACLGSDLWTIGSQSLWQHGPAALALVATGWLLATRDLSHRRAFAAGITVAAMVACRSINLPFAVLTFAWVAWRMPNRLVSFLPGPIVIGSALIAYNLYFFGSLGGGQDELEAVHPVVHGVSGAWTIDPIGGLLGTLFSPSRGLFIYCPWTFFAILFGPRAWSTLRPFGHTRWMIAGLIIHLAILSFYSVWWGGHCFGPRYWTEVMPLFAVLFALGLQWAHRASRRLLVVARLLLVLSIVVQSIGATLYPSSWNGWPLDVDRHHERLWHWLDNEVTRCLYEYAERESKRGRSGFRE